MENNSIKGNLSKDDIVSDIVLCIGADIEKQNIYLLVEGEDDISLLKDKMAKNVYIYESYDGKNGVEYIVNDFFCDKKYVIGLRDKDYQEVESSDKIFFYDQCCMEMMIVANDDSFHSVTTEYYDGSMKDGELREYLLNELKIMSIIRMLNEKEQWGIIIKGISIDNAFNRETRKLDYEVIFSKLRSMNELSFSEEKIEKIMTCFNVEWKFKDFLNKTQGHDFTMLYSTVCSIYKKRRGISYKNIEAGLRCAFRVSDFKQTDLYGKIVQYQNEIGIKCI